MYFFVCLVTIISCHRLYNVLIIIISGTTIVYASGFMNHSLPFQRTYLN
jgi:hypothetical protein